MTGDPTTRAPLSRRTVVLGSLTGFPISAAFLALALRHVDEDRLMSAVRAAAPTRLLLAVVVMGAVYVVQALRWRVIADSGISTGRFLEWVVGSAAVNNVVPGRPGDLLRAEWLSRASSRPRGGALATVVVDRSSDVLVLAVCLAATSSVTRHPTWLVRLDMAAATAGVLLLAVLGLFALLARRDDSVVGGRLRRLLDQLAAGVAGAVRPARLAPVLALSVVAWLLSSAATWLVASSIGLELTPAEALFVTAVLNLGVAIPSSPGFIGTYQWLGIASLGLLAVDRSDALAFSILMHATWFVPTSVAGIGLAVYRFAPPVARRLRAQAA